MVNAGVQMSLTETWVYADEAEAAEWLPVWRNGGPRDGARLGTAYPNDEGGLSVHIGYDENGEVLPGFAGGAS